MNLVHNALYIAHFRVGSLLGGLVCPTSLLQWKDKGQTKTGWPFTPSAFNIVDQIGCVTWFLIMQRQNIWVFLEQDGFSDECNHFQVFGYRSLNHCLLHGFTFMALFSGWIMAIYLSQQWYIYSNADNRR